MTTTPTNSKVEQNDGHGIAVTDPAAAEPTPTEGPMVVQRDPAHDPSADGSPLRYMTIHEAMGRILAELPAIGKNQRNQSQGFNFRGVDDVLNALNPLLGKYGVYILPNVIDRNTSRRETKGGGVMFEVNLHVKFTFHGPSGDAVVASGWGEGTDSGDKATNKAMTAAYKYVLFQAFAISTEEASNLDSDRGSPEPSTEPSTEPTPQQQRKEKWGEKPLPEGWSSFEAMDTANQEFMASMVKAPDDVKAKVTEFRTANELAFPLGMTDLARVKDYVLSLANAILADPPPDENGDMWAADPEAGLPAVPK